MKKIKKLQGGNCLCKALYLMYRLRTWKLRPSFHGGRLVPHFYVEDKRGRFWHFKSKIDVLPWPLSFLFFYGYIKVSKLMK